MITRQWVEGLAKIELWHLQCWLRRRRFPKMSIIKSENFIDCRRELAKFCGQNCVQEKTKPQTKISLFNDSAYPHLVAHSWVLIYRGLTSASWNQNRPASKSRISGAALSKFQLNAKWKNENDCAPSVEGFNLSWEMAWWISCWKPKLLALWSDSFWCQS